MRAFFFRISLFLAAWLTTSAPAQTLFNVDFGAGDVSAKVGFAGTGRATNDHWNLYSHYHPRFVPGTAMIANGNLPKLKLSDGTDSAVSIAVANAPGVWGNTTGDPMYDSYIFAPNGSNIVVTIAGLESGRYHFYLYGHADPDATGEMSSIFRIRSGGTNYGPLTTLSSAGWKATQPWREENQFVVFRDVVVDASRPVVIDVAPGPNGVAVLNGLQIVSRGSGAPRPATPSMTRDATAYTNLVFREVAYEGRVADNEARFAVTLDVESLTTNEISAPLFAGDVAVIPGPLPPELRIARVAGQYRLVVSAPGNYKPKLEVIAKISRLEPWNQISFTGPPAAIASISAQAPAGVELQMTSGAPVDAEKTGAATKTGDFSRIRGFIGPDQTVALRWQSKTTEVARKSLITVDTTANAQIAPTVIKFTTVLRYELLQASVAKLTLLLPASHALTRLQGDQIRDWNVKREGAAQVLTVEFVKPVEKNYTLTLFSEQSVDATPFQTSLAPPQPLEVERESGSFTIGTDDVTVEVESAAGLRQVNAAAGTFAAYRFYGRPFALPVLVKRIEPIVNTADRVTARLEETRLQITHGITLTVEKAGIYAAEFATQPGFVVADVKGEGLEDWKVTGGKLRVSFAARVLGARRLDVQLEQSQKTFPTNIVALPLRFTGAAKETASVGAASAAGIRLKTAELTGLREIPINQLAARSDELLAFTADQPDWQLSLAAERLPTRIVAEVFNLVTVGDGLVGGSATVRYGIINQGVQEFRVRVPAHWKNVEFIGTNIRRKEQRTNEWTISLQDKAWGGYTLVVTYDYAFDPQQALLDAAGLHALDVERETGSVAITTAASLKLVPRPVSEPLRVIDPTELAATDRALIARPVLLAYRYTGNGFALQLDVNRHAEERVLDAVADRTQLTSVLTDAGEMLTQASFMVKNNDRQFQAFTLPAGEKTLWGAYVNNQPVKAERDAGKILVSLPRWANRDEAFAVDLVYAEKLDALKAGLWPQRISLVAPQTDVPNTYAEWQLYVPVTKRLTSFGGNMTVARGTEYGLHDAWQRFLEFYQEFWQEHGAAIIIVSLLGLLVGSLIIQAVRRGFQGMMSVVVLFAILSVLAGMMLPALSKAKSKAQRINSASNLKQIGVAARLFANDHDGRFPNTFEEMMNELSSEKVLIDPDSNERYVYVGAGKSESMPDAIIAYSPTDINGRNVAFADGHVAMLNSTQFAEAQQRDAVVVAHAQVGGGGGGLGGASVSGQKLDETVGLQSEMRQRGGAGESESKKETSIDGRQVKPTGAAAPEMAVPPPAAPAVGGGVNNGVVAAASLGLGDNSRGFFSNSVAVLPSAAGIRSIRIEIPRSGQSFTFTKVLNSTGEPLAVRMSVMNYNSFRAARSVLQLGCFLLGLVLIWVQWSKTDRNSLWFAVGLSLAAVAVGNLLISGRVLHFGFIAAVPISILILLWFVIKKWWSRRGDRIDFPADDSPRPPVIPPPATIGLFFLVPFLAASALAQDKALPMPAPSNPQVATINSATYTGMVRERTAQFDATILLQSAATNNQTFPLFGDDVAVTSFTVKSGDAKLVREGGGVSLLLAKRGAVTLEMKLIVKLGGDGTRRRLEFGLPPALSSRLMATLDEPEADVEFPSAVSFKRTTAAQQTLVEAVIGASDRVELQWTPRMKRIEDMDATVFSQSTIVVTVGGGVVNTRAILDYTVAQGELRQAKVRLPAGQRLLRVEGEWIRTWEILAEGGSETLLVDLVKGVSPGWRLTVETERVLGALPATAKIEVPHAIEVKRETGLVGVRGTEEVALTLEPGAELQRVDTAEFLRVAKEKITDVNSAYRFLKTDFSLTVTAETVQPQIEAIVREHLRIGPEQLHLSAMIDYTIKKAGVFTLKVAVPPGWKVESVSTDTKVGGAAPASLQWIERKEAGQLEINLPERTTGAWSLHVELSQTIKELPKNLAVPGVHPLGTEKLLGFVSVASEPGVSVKTETFDGLTEIPASQIPSRPGFVMVAPRGGAQSSLLAFKFVTGEPGPAASWKLSVLTEAVESWIRAEVANVITVSETLVSGRALVRYEIANAPVKDFQIRVPAGYTNVEISGMNIRRRDSTGGVWRVELQSKVRGVLELNVTWEQTRAQTNAVLDLPGVEAVGVERETGTVAILARAPLQVLERSASAELVKIDPRELPDWAGVNTTAPAGSGAAGDAVVLAYRYLRAGFKLGVTSQRFADAEVLQTLADSIKLTTVVADDGQVMTEMVLEVRNNGRQFLELELPPKSTVWSAFVGGQPVRPSKVGNKLLLPLEKSGAEDAPLAIELIYVGTEKFPKRRGAVALASPTLDVPFKNARWELFLPRDYEFSNFGGSMAHETVEAPVLEVFSAAAYGMIEAGKRKARQVESFSVLSSAREELSKGNVGGANALFARGQANNPNGDAQTQKDLKDLEQELNRAQSSNLIGSQNNFALENYSRFNGGGAQAKMPNPAAGGAGQQLFGNLEYDAEVAAQQVAKLQRQQEIAIAKVQPLRVNLPTHGQKLAFTQVLQTATKKAMTVSFDARNTKAISWPGRFFSAAGLFALLWIVAGLWPERRRLR